MSGKVCESACAILGAAGLWSQLSCQSEDLHPNPLGLSVNPLQLFPVMVLKTSLSSVHLVPAPAGSCKEPLWRFSAFSSFFISAGSCCFVVTSNFSWAVSLCVVSSSSGQPVVWAFFHLASRGGSSSLLVDYFGVNLKFLEGSGM